METMSRGVTRGDVVACYRAFLKREPENENVVASKMARCATLDDLLNEFIGSKEFIGARSPKLSYQNGVVAVFHTNNDDKIEVDVSDDIMNEILDCIITQWTALGETEPYWAVLSGDAFKQKNIDNNMEEFYSSGESGFNVIEQFCKRNRIARPKGICMELGCGVGRVTQSLAANFERVIGFDVSEPILRLADARMKSSGITNCDLHVLRHLDDLREAGPWDFFYSIIVLQHNPPPVMKRMLQISVERLKPGGAFLFQIPTHRQDYTFSAESYLGKHSKTSAGFEMHVLPMHVVMDTIADAGCRIKEVIADNYAGHPGSHTFFGVKP